MTDTTVTTTPPSSPAPAAPPPSAAAPVATPAATPALTPTPTPSTPTVATPTVAAAAPPRPADFPEAFWDTEKNGPNVAKINEIVVAHAANESRRLSLPQKADDVKLDLPADFQLPQGVEFKFDPAKPEYNKFRELAVSEGLSQDTVTKLTGLFAEIMVGDQASIQQWETAEMTRLGANGPARATAIKTALTGMIGEAKTAHLQTMLRTAGGVEALEAMVAKFSSQGVATFSQGGREPVGSGNKPSEEQWGKMSAAERMDYTNKTDQTKFKAA